MIQAGIGIKPSMVSRPLYKIDTIGPVVNSGTTKNQSAMKPPLNKDFKMNAGKLSKLLPVDHQKANQKLELILSK